MTNGTRHDQNTLLLRSMHRRETQLDLDLGELHVPAGPAWESLPEACRVETVTVLARLVAKAGSAEEPSDV